MSLSDIVNLIEQHKEANKDQYNHANKNKQQQTPQGETETFGRADGKTLEELLMEDD